MIDLHYWPTPNGWKISIMLEECGLPYRCIPVNIGQGEQFRPEFLAISPNNRMPAIVDPDGPDGAPVSVFESGAILQYLGRKTGKFYPSDERARVEVDQWLMWQMGGLGPMSGQNGHFRVYAPEKVPYAIERYGNEVNRLYGVLDGQLQRTGAHVAGEAYSIADMAILPWYGGMVLGRSYNAAEFLDVTSYKNVLAWAEKIDARPAVKRGRMVNKSWGEDNEKLPERHSAADFAGKAL